MSVAAELPATRKPSSPFLWPTVQRDQPADLYEQEVFDPKSQAHTDAWKVVSVTLRRRRKSLTRKRPMFVYLMSSGSSPFIGLASDPMRRVLSHNRLLPSGAKATRSGAPDWRVQLIIGPFYRGGARFKREWCHRSRRLHPRIAHGIGKALEYKHRGLRVFARDPQEMWRIYWVRRRQTLQQRRPNKVNSCSHTKGSIAVYTTPNT